MLGRPDEAPAYMMTDDTAERFDIDKPLWSQQTFMGRMKHFFWVTDFRTIFTSKQELYEAKDLISEYRAGREPEGTTRGQLVRAKKLYESSFHPDTGDLQNVFGRMSFQVPGGMTITGLMLQFYKTNTAVIFWQWANQSFNALVNYTNRNAASDTTTTQIAVAYVSATSAALFTAIGLKKFLATRASPLMQRFVPFAAVAAANMINIPLMRQSELANGIALTDESNQKVADSKYAAATGITQVVISRIVIATPGMTLLPVIMEQLEKRAWFRRLHRLHLPFQALMLGGVLLIMVPVGCAVYPQTGRLTLEKLKRADPSAYDEIQRQNPDETLTVRFFYFNKGL